MKKLSSVQVNSFQRKIWDFYTAHGRHVLPWRPPKLKVKKGQIDMYKIMVSEIMLQQTQVSRVGPKFKEWIQQFPNISTLEQASRKDVLTLWQGLGYTRRAKFLHESAQKIIKNGTPKNIEELENLPGIGHYTSRAIATFAWNESHSFVETNIRSVYINHFFKNKEIIADVEIINMVAQTLDKTQPREWMYALMDYGSHLKSQGKAHNARSKSFARQSKFQGSVREVRGSIMKFFAEKSILNAKNVLEFENIFDNDRVQKALAGLTKDGLITQISTGYKV